MPLLELKKLTKNFGGLAAVSQLELSVERGEIVGLIGPNGAGKTTVFNMISGLLRPTSGKVLFKGEDITGMKPHSVVRKGLARTFQLTLLFGDFTVLENILVGFHLKARMGLRAAFSDAVGTRSKKPELFKEVSELTEFMGLAEKQNELAKNLPHGYQKSLDMAIALAAKPELLLLDEPVTGMTAVEIRQMMNKIVDAKNKGMTIFLVEHHVKVVMDICDRIYVLNFGKKIAEGSPEEVSRNKDVIAAYLGREYASRY